MGPSFSPPPTTLEGARGRQAGLGGDGRDGGQVEEAAEPGWVGASMAAGKEGHGRWGHALTYSAMGRALSLS